MSTGLKNAQNIIPSVLDVVQFSVNEECSAKGDCNSFMAFINAGKPVFHIEYPHGNDMSNTTPVTDVNKWCFKTDRGVDISLMSTVIKDMDLDGWVQYCNKETYKTSLKNV